ncbi:MAG TPA: hypothetical protein VIK24_17960 [Pyrinomonadaceae bacterium]|jgi:hypothetical protein
MSSKRIQIDQLKLRIHDLSQHQGRELGNRVASLLSRIEPKHERQKIEHLNVVITKGQSGSVETIAQQVVTEIKRRLI